MDEENKGSHLQSKSRLRRRCGNLNQVEYLRHALSCLGRGLWVKPWRRAEIVIEMAVGENHPGLEMTSDAVGGIVEDLHGRGLTRLLVILDRSDGTNSGQRWWMRGGVEVQSNPRSRDILRMTRVVFYALMKINRAHSIAIRNPVRSHNGIKCDDRGESGVGASLERLWKLASGGFWMPEGLMFARWLQAH